MAAVAASSRSAAGEAAARRSWGIGNRSRRRARPLTTELSDLCQKLILDHYRRPRNRRSLDDADRSAEGYDPFCGDHVRIYLRLRDNVITDVKFEGSGCAISTASVSIMTEALQGRTLDQARRIFTVVHRLLTGQPWERREYPLLGKLEVFSNVCRYPARVKCATLAWHTLQAALE